MLPISLHKALCSLACHGNNNYSIYTILKYFVCTHAGAIKFGDSLTVEQCSELIASLSKCKLPFQCAHGRSVKTYIVELQLLLSAHLGLL